MAKGWFGLWQRGARDTRARGFLARLRKDRRGNTLAIMAAALIPLSALAGSAVDMARLYVVKVRLQQACDAGALAGRKFMLDSNSSTLDANASAQATQFFKNNFTDGWMRTGTASFTPSKTADNQVAGAASVVVPMTVMRMFQAGDQTINVTCEARFDLADADIMFVLDTTGSMACAPANSSCSQANLSYTKDDGTTGYYVQEKSNSKLDALRDAVVDFDTTMRSNADPSTNIRYGFVTYSSSVNVGKLIPTNYLVDSWNYQTRRLIGEVNSGSAFSVTLSGYNSSTCSSANGRYPAGSATDRAAWNTDSTAYYISAAAWTSNQCKATRQNVIPNWRYQQWPQDVSQFKLGVDVIDPTRLDNRKARWSGCVEERQTTTASTFDIDNLPSDLDPDLIPTNDATKWKPHWSAVTWDRAYKTSEDSSASDTSRANSSYRPYGEEYLQSRGYSTCGVPALPLKIMSASEVSNYVNGNDFRALGGTYHDVGMIWGVRMLSPNGIFASYTAPAAGRNPPARHIVFMTDGQMAPNADIYGQYGIETFDNRVAGGATDTTTLTNRHTARFLAECSYAKDRLNVTVWVVALGTSLTTDLKKCASPGDHAFTATSKNELRDAFKTIATQVAMLRVSK